MLVYLKGRKIEIGEQGINIGKRYLGPYKIKSEVSAYKIPKLKESDLFISWENINIVAIGIWERFWARHWNLVGNFLAGEETSISEKAALLMGIPVKKLKGYFITIETKESEIYAVEVNALMANNAEQAIRNFERGDLLDNNGYNV